MARFGTNPMISAFLQAQGFHEDQDAPLNAEAAEGGAIQIFRGGFEESPGSPGSRQETLASKEEIGVSYLALADLLSFFGWLIEKH